MMQVQVHINHSTRMNNRLRVPVSASNLSPASALRKSYTKELKICQKLEGKSSTRSDLVQMMYNFSAALFSSRALTRS